MNKTQSDQMGIGPQYPKDNSFTARMRFHQSWYRARVLKAPFGCGPKPSSKTEYGNMLTRLDGERGLNFSQPTYLSNSKTPPCPQKGYSRTVSLAPQYAFQSADVFQLVWTFGR